MVKMLPEIIALSVALIAIVAEWIHCQRIRRVRHLAFGPRGKAAMWTTSVPLLRVLALAAASWGFASLLFVVEAEVHNQNKIEENEYKNLVLVVDVSPSMRLADAGPDRNQTRRLRASQLLESVFNRVPMRQFKVTIIAVYTDAKMLLEGSKDHEVVRHIMETMPLYHAFKPGKTKLMSGIEQAAKVAKGWNPGSTFVMLLTDGDTVPTTGMPKMPVSVAEVMVVGVGDPNSGSFIDGHMSRQDVNTLRQVANRLRGVYHNGNKKHLTSKLVNSLAETKEDKSAREWGRREWSLLAIAFGTGTLSLIPMLLHYFGTPFRSGVKSSPRQFSQPTVRTAGLRS